jgi:hypothetical protein
MKRKKKNNYNKNLKKNNTGETIWMQNKSWEIKKNKKIIKLYDERINNKMICKIKSNKLESLNET